MLFALDVLGRALAVLEQQPAGLFTDLDGTISAIAPTPEAATISAPCRRSLASLCQRLALVAVVSGRAADDARRLVKVPGIVYVGNHGLEIWRHGGSEPFPEAQDHETVVQLVLADVAERVGALPGVRFENKRLTASIHYRLADDPTAARAAILAALRLSPLATQLRLVEGRKVVELRPAIAVDKGTAVEALLASRGLRGAVYLGDDTTDVDAFRALKAWSERTGHPGLTVAVTAAGKPAVSQAADLTVSGVEEVEELLRALAALLPLRSESAVAQRTGAEDVALTAQAGD